MQKQQQGAAERGEYRGGGEEREAEVQKQNQMENGIESNRSAFKWNLLFVPMVCVLVLCLGSTHAHTQQHKQQAASSKWGEWTQQTSHCLPAQQSEPLILLLCGEFARQKRPPPVAAFQSVRAGFVLTPPDPKESEREPQKATLVMDCAPQWAWYVAQSRESTIES